MTTLTLALFFALVVLPGGAVCLAKGKPFMAIFGLLTLSYVAIVGAIRLAKPESWWARRFYNDEKLERARARFPEEHAVATERHDELLAAWEGVEINPDELDPITRRALKKAGRL